MAARIVRLSTRPDRLKAQRADDLRQSVMAFETEAPAAVAALLAVIDRHAAAEKGWTFVMLSPDQNRAVVRWLDAHSKRPRVAVRLWAELFVRMRMDTGEIVADRQHLAEAVGAHPNHVSTVLGEMQRCGAVIRRREGHTVRWFMNPRVGTCLAGTARDTAQAAASSLRLVPPA